MCPCGSHAPRSMTKYSARVPPKHDGPFLAGCSCPCTQHSLDHFQKNNTTRVCPPTRSRPRVTTSARSAALSASDRVRSSRRAAFAALHAAKSTRRASCDARSASCGPGCHKCKTTHVTDSTRPLRTFLVALGARCPPQYPADTRRDTCQHSPCLAADTR